MLFIALIISAKFKLYSPKINGNILAIRVRSCFDSPADIKYLPINKR